jgi:hypothetical protein
MGDSRSPIPTSVLSDSARISWLQHSLLSLSEETLDSVLESILAMPLARTARGAATLARNLLHLLELRRSRSALFAWLSAQLHAALWNSSRPLGRIFKDFFLSHAISPHVDRDYAFHFLYECCAHSFIRPSEIIDRVVLAARRGVRGGFRTAFLPLADRAALPALLREVGVDPPDLAGVRDAVRWGCRPGTVDWAVVTDDAPLLARLLAEHSRPAATAAPIRLFDPIAFRDLLGMILYFGARQCFRQFLVVNPDPSLFVTDVAAAVCCGLTGGDVEAIRWLLALDGALPALLANAHVPALCHRLDLVEWILAQCPQPREPLAAVLHAAARSNCVEIALFAIARGVDVNCKANGAAPIHCAAARDSNDVFRILMSHPAIAVNSIDENTGETPLHIAAKLGNEVMLELLLARGDVDVNCLKPGREQTPLILAVRECHVGIVATLLADKRVDVNAHDQEQRRAIHYAAIANSLEIVKLLKDRGNLYARAVDVHGDTALALAQQCSKSREIITELERLSVPPAYRPILI